MDEEQENVISKANAAFVVENRRGQDKYVPEWTEDVEVHPK